jgi:hypothetical protein
MPTGLNEYRRTTMEMDGLSVNLGQDGITHQEIWYLKQEDKIFIGERPGSGWELIGWVDS